MWKSKREIIFQIFFIAIFVHHAIFLVFGSFQSLGLLFSVKVPIETVSKNRQSVCSTFLVLSLWTHRFHSCLRLSIFCLTICFWMVEMPLKQINKGLPFVLDLFSSCSFWSSKYCEVFFVCWRCYFQTQIINFRKCEVFAIAPSFVHSV